MTLTPERIEEIERPEWATDTTDALWRDGRKYVADYVQWLNAGNSIGSLSPHAATALIHHFAHALAKSALSTSRVKALVWTDRRVFGSRKICGVSPFGEWCSIMADELSDTGIEMLKAEHQASYEARILSTLEPAPAPATVTERMR